MAELLRIRSARRRNARDHCRSPAHHRGSDPRKQCSTRSRVLHAASDRPREAGPQQSHRQRHRLAEARSQLRAGQAGDGGHRASARVGVPGLEQGVGHHDADGLRLDRTDTDTPSAVRHSRCSRLRPADRVRERREPDARPRSGTQARDRIADGDRRSQAAARPAGT